MKLSRNKKRTIQGLMAGAILTLAGCGNALVGNWKQTTPPKDSSAPYISAATFKDDGTYTANERRGQDNTTLAGKYDFNGFQLKLKTAGKAERTMNATFYMNGTLQLKEGSISQTLKKQ